MYSESFICIVVQLHAWKSHWFTCNKWYSSFNVPLPIWWSIAVYVGCINNYASCFADLLGPAWLIDEIVILTVKFPRARFRVLCSAVCAEFFLHTYVITWDRCSAWKKTATVTIPIFAIKVNRVVQALIHKGGPLYIARLHSIRAMWIMKSVKHLKLIYITSRCPRHDIYTYMCTYTSCNMGLLSLSCPSLCFK